MLTLDCENSCRICLIESDKLCSIFENSNQQDNRSLSEIISEISGVQIDQNDKLSKKICNECRLKALELIAFKQLCIDSDETVRYNLLLEDHEDDQTIVEVLENEEADETQDMSYEADVLQLGEEEDSLIEDSTDAIIEDNDEDEFEVLDLREIDVNEEININTSNNVAIISKNSENLDLDEVTEKMKAAHYAKEQLKKHKCPYCDKTFMYPSKVNRHVLAVHRDLNRPKKNIKKNHFCPICDKAFVSQFKVRRHMVVHDTELKTGLQKNWTRNYLMCQRCSRKFHTNTTYGRHTIICDRLMKSNLSRPENYQYKCVMCLDNFKQHDDMVDHMKNFHHQQGDQQIVCMLCSNFTGIVSDMIRHGRNHEENATYRCCDCGKFFPNGDEIYIHLLRHANYKPYECTHEGCSKRFFDRYKLRNHLATHDPNVEKKYICDECQRPFTQLEYLNCHKRRKHSTIKPYSCNFCTKAFAFHHDLNLHLTVHTGNKKHVCNICEASFTKAWSLKQHLTTHETGASQLHCNECNYSTISKAQLQKHMQSHNKVKYLCEECELEFKTENELKFHIDEAHQSQYSYMDGDPYSLVEIPTSY